MAKNQLIVLGVGLLLTIPALADDAASGKPTGKRQHKPVSATQPQEEAEETRGTRVRKPMQDLKNNAQDATPAMNKAELTETLASDAGLSKADAKRAVEPGRSPERRAPERLRHKDRSVDDKTDKNEAARARKKEKPPQ